FFFFSSRRRHTRSKRDWSSDVCSSDLVKFLHLTGCHFVFEVPLDNSLSIFVEKLFDIPYLDLASCIPFLKPVFYGCAPFVFWPQIGRASCRERVYVAGVDV